MLLECALDYEEALTVHHLLSPPHHHLQVTVISWRWMRLACDWEEAPSVHHLSPP